MGTRQLSQLFIWYPSSLFSQQSSALSLALFLPSLLFCPTHYITKTVYLEWALNIPLWRQKLDVSRFLNKYCSTKSMLLCYQKSETTVQHSVCWSLWTILVMPQNKQSKNRLLYKASVASLVWRHVVFFKTPISPKWPSVVSHRPPPCLISFSLPSPPPPLHLTLLHLDRKEFIAQLRSMLH